MKGITVTPVEVVDTTPGITPVDSGSVSVVITPISG
jgi:hypothetical protein